MTSLPMTFSEAYELLAQGQPIKRAHWLGYWIKTDDNDVVIHCKDGSKVSMKNGCLPLFTLNQTIANDWIALDADEQDELDRIHEAKLLEKAKDQADDEMSHLEKEVRDTLPDGLKLESVSKDGTITINGEFSSLTPLLSIWHSKTNNKYKEIGSLGIPGGFSVFFRKNKQLP